MAEAPTARKVQLSVPVVDSTVVEWLDLQYSASESIRRLIRESVAREGFVDVANRPVRPPAHPVYVAENLPDDEDPVPAPPASEPKAVKPKAAEPKAAEPKAAEPKAAEPKASARTPAPPASASTSPAPKSPAAAPAAEPDANADATATIDDLLGL
ncbi:hypothetical protein Q9R19_09040 [Microbacterium sp. ARD32]|uniref:hypothetical protein n=1 Tax=Microbacterium sp. ARD32 TaxID=2962577 RepID=UPI002882CB52|nr:hypothetical protein [Microbacterium sp. ARD32]MDT0157768.1 hypothetical protein [Microbacterium sp. ARD32]